MYFFFLTHGLFWSMLLSFQIVEDFLDILLLPVSNLILLWPEKIYSASFHFFYVYWCFFKSHSRLSILVNVSHAFKKGVYSGVLMYNKCQLSQLMSVMFKSSMYLLIFFNLLNSHLLRERYWNFYIDLCIFLSSVLPCTSHILKLCF